MTLERLAELKLQYQKESEYFKNIGFDRLATKFSDVVNILIEIENEKRAQAPAAQEAQDETRT